MAVEVSSRALVKKRKSRISGTGRCRGQSSARNDLLLMCSSEKRRPWATENKTRSLIQRPVKRRTHAGVNAVFLKGKVRRPVVVLRDNEKCSAKIEKVNSDLIVLRC